MFSHLADKKKVKGILYIVSTPIGNLEDITLRAIEVLKNVDIIAAETPKITKRLLDKYNINTKLIMNNKNNERIKKNKMANSEYLSKNGFYVPSGLALKNAEIKYICNLINKILN